MNLDGAHQVASAWLVGVSNVLRVVFLSIFKYSGRESDGVFNASFIFEVRSLEGERILNFNAAETVSAVGAIT